VGAGAGTLVALATASALGLLALLVLLPLLTLLPPVAVSSALGLWMFWQDGDSDELDLDLARKIGMSSSGGFEDRGRARWEMARRIVDLRLGGGLTA
jgi:hypothetical protein